MVGGDRNNSFHYDMSILKYMIKVSLYIYLIVDTFAGFLVARHLPNIGQLYKIIVVLMMLLYILSKNRNLMLIISFLFALMFIIPLNFLFSTFANISYSLTIIFKAISIYIFYEYCQKEIERKEIDKIFLINYIVFVLNIFAGILGFAKGTYNYGDESVGTTGFFYAGNEVTYTFLCLTFWFLIRYNLKPIIKYIISLTLAVLIGTKAGMLGTLLLIFVDMYYSAKPKNRIKIIILSLFILFVLCFTVYTFLQDNPLYKYIAFKIKQNSGRGKFPVLNAVLSGRLERIPIIQEIYERNFSLFTFFFGLGFPLSIKFIEMDFFEFFYYYGFFAFSLLVLFYINILYLSWMKNNKKQFFFNIICIAISFLAGHVVYSVMGGIFFVMNNSMKYEEKVMEKSKNNRFSKIAKKIFAYNF